jgi:predicted DNA-binding transcriptional regulator AlpA
MKDNLMSNSANDRLVRINSIIGNGGVLPLSASSWWNGVKSGLYPQPIKLGPNITAWRWSDIQNLIENGVQEGGTKDA